MKQHSVQFLPAEDSIDARGKQDTRMQNAIDCGSGLPGVEPHGNAVYHETGCGILAAGRDLNLSTIATQAQDQPCKHGKHTRHPYHGKSVDSPALCHVPYRIADSAER